MGTIDGAIGPRSLRAIDEYLRADEGVTEQELRVATAPGSGSEQQEARARLFERLFGYQPADEGEFEDMMECLDLKLLQRAIARPAEGEGQEAEEEQEETNGRLRVPGPTIEFNFETERRNDDREHENGLEQEDVNDRLPGIRGFESPGGGFGFGF